MHSGQQPIRYGWHHIEGVVFAFGISRESPENLKAIDDLMAREGESNGLNIILYHPEFEIYEIRRGGADRALLKEINFAGRKLAWIFLEDPNHDQIKNSIYVHHQAALPNLFYKSEEQACIQEQVDNLFKQVVSTNTTLLAKPKKNLPNKLLYSEWYKNKLLALSDEEVKALATATPCQYRGGPGTGKTVIVLRWLRLQAQLGKKVAFITKNIKLLEKKKNEFITQYPNVEIRFASPNELLAEKESKKANPKKIMTRERYIELLTKEIKNYKSTLKNKDDFPLTIEEAEKELRVCGGYNKVDYSNLGERDSKFGGINNRLLRLTIYPIKEKMELILERAHALYEDLSELELAEKFDAVGFDEGHDCPLIQVKSIAKNTAKNNNFVIVHDPNQEIYDGVDNKEAYINRLSEEIGKSISICLLTEEFRSSPAICQGINLVQVLINFRSNQQEKYLKCSNDNEGDIQWCIINQKTISETQKLVKKSDDFVIITPFRNKDILDEAFTVFPGGTIQTVEDYKGLEHKNVFLYRFFDDPANFDLLSELNEFLREKYEKNPELDKVDLETFFHSNRQENKNVKFLKLLLVAISRAEGSVIILQEYKNAFVYVFKFLRKGRKILSEIDFTHLQFELNTKESCLQYARELEDYGYVRQAKEKIRLYLEKELAEENAKQETKNETTIKDETTKKEFTTEEIEKAYQELIVAKTTKVIVNDSELSKEIKPVANVADVVVGENKSKRHKKRKKAKAKVLPPTLTNQSGGLVNTNNTVNVVPQEKKNEIRAAEEPGINGVISKMLTSILLDYKPEKLTNILLADSMRCLQYLFESKVIFKDEKITFFECIISMDDERIWHDLIKHLKSDNYDHLYKLFPSDLGKVAANSDEIHVGLGQLINKAAKYIDIVVIIIAWACEKNLANLCQYILVNYPPKFGLFNEIFIKAVENGKIEIAKELIFSRTINVDYQNSISKRTALHFAAKDNYIELADILIRAGANVDVIDVQKITPLIAATWQGNFEIVRKLLLKGVDNYVNGSALVSAAKHGHLKLVEYLLAAGFYVDHVDIENKQNALSAAANKGWVDVVNILLKNDANTNIKALEKKALYFAVINGHEEIVKILIANMADVDAEVTLDRSDVLALAKKINGVNKIESLIKQHDKFPSFTALHAACIIGNENIVKMLIKANARVFTQTNEFLALYFAETMGHLSFLPLLRNHMLFIAARNGNPTIVEQLWKKGATLDYRGKFGFTVLHQAAGSKDLKAVEFLCKENAPADVANEHNDTPFILAVGKEPSCLVILDELLKKGANINHKGQHGRTALHWAIEGGFDPVANFLINHPKIMCDIPDKFDDTPLLLAFRKENLPIIQTLYRKGANLGYVGQWKRTPLHEAVIKGNIKIVEFLIDEKIEINPLDRENSTPFMMAVECGHEEVVKKLFATEKIDLKQKNVVNRTVLHCAAFGGSIEILKFLLDKNVEINCVDIEGNTPFLLYAIKEQLPMMKQIFATGKVDLNQAGQNGFTPLHHGARHGNIEIIKFLINKVNVNAVDAENMTPFMWAAANGHLQALEILFATGKIKVNQTSDYQMTALHRAALKGHAPIVRFLIRKKANVNATTDDKLTPFLCAVESGSLETVKELFNTKKIDLNHCNDDCEAALNIAVKNEHKKIVEFLLSKNISEEDINKAFCTAVDQGLHDIVQILFATMKVNVNYQNDNFDTPLHLAVREGNLSIVKFLVKQKNININARDEEGNTPLIWAINEKYTRIALELLINKANPNLIGKDKRTALHCAAVDSEDGIITQFLIDSKAKINSYDDSKNTPFIQAASKGSLSTMEALFATGEIDPYYQGQENLTAIHWAILNVHKDKVEFFIRNNIVMTFAVKISEEFLLEKAKIINRDVQLAEVLKTHPKIVTAFTPLCAAVLTGNREIIELLINHDLESLPNCILLANALGREEISISLQNYELAKKMISNRVPMSTLPFILANQINNLNKEPQVENDVKSIKFTS